MKNDIVAQQNNLTNNLTNEVKFEPTPHMLVWLDTALRLETDSISEISQKCKITRQTWYEWLRNEAFIKWFRDEWDKRLSGHAWKLDAIGMKNARRDYNYWKSMQERVGNLVDKPSTLQQFNLGKDNALIIQTTKYEQEFNNLTSKSEQDISQQQNE